MHETMRRANNAKSKIRSRVEHVFAEQKDRMGLFIRTIGIAEQRLRSEWPISSTTSNALSSCARSPSHDRLVLRKAAHSSQSQIPIKRWTVKFTKANPRGDGSTPPVDLATPLFGYQNHVSIDRRFGFIRWFPRTELKSAFSTRRINANSITQLQIVLRWHRQL